MELIAIILKCRKADAHKAVLLCREIIMNNSNIVERRNAEIRNNWHAKLHTMEEGNDKHKEKAPYNRDDVNIFLKTADEEGSWSQELAHLARTILKLVPSIRLVHQDYQSRSH